MFEILFYFARCILINYIASNIPLFVITMLSLVFTLALWCLFKSYLRIVA